jgi:hypothetical protein
MHHGRTRAAQPLGLGRSGTGIHPDPVEHGPIAESNLDTLDTARHALAGGGREALRLGELQPTGSCRVQDGPCQRVLAAAL